MITIVSGYQDEYEAGIEVPVDEGRCQLRIACGDPGAPIGLSSEGNYIPVAVLAGDDDPADTPPVLACEDCESWLRDLYQKELKQ